MNILALFCLMSFVCGHIKAMEARDPAKQAAEKKTKKKKELSRAKKERRRRSCSKSLAEEARKVHKEARPKKAASLSAESGSSCSITPDISPRELPQLLRYVAEDNVNAVEQHAEDLRNDPPVDDEGNGPFHFVRSVSMFRVLLRIRSIALDARNNQNETPLHRVASNGLSAVVQEFLQFITDFNVQDASGNTPLHRAFQSGHGDTARLLLIGNSSGASNVHLTNTASQTPLTLALLGGHFVEALLILHMHYPTNAFATELNARDSAHNLPLFLALRRPFAADQSRESSHEQSETVKTEGEEPRVNETPSPDQLRLELITALLAAGARVDLDDELGSVLHRVPTAEIAEVLLTHMESVARSESRRDRGVDRRCNGNLNTPLHDAISPAIVEVLVRHKANINARNGCGDYLPIEAATDESIVRKLIELGAEVPLNFVRKGRREKLIAVLSKDTYKDKNGNTLLHMTPSQEIAKLCLDGGLSHDVTNREGQTPLHVTQNLEVAELLVQSGALVNALDNHGNTPLHMVNDPEIFELLVSSGADVRAVNLAGLSVYQTANNPTIRGRLEDLLGIAPVRTREVEERPIIPQIVNAQQVLASSNNTVETRRQRRGLGSLRIPGMRSLLPGKSSSLGNKNK